jgi:hypothetical protein
VAVTDASGPVVRFNFKYDVTTSRLEYHVNPEKTREADVIGIWIHRATGEKLAAAVYQLDGGASTSASGALVFSFADRQVLSERRLRVRVYTKQRPGGIDSALELP